MLRNSRSSDLTACDMLSLHYLAEYRLAAKTLGLHSFQIVHYFFTAIENMLYVTHNEVLGIEILLVLFCCS